jgi:copper chaperone
MEERRYRTSAKCNGCVSAIAGKLDEIMGREDWNIDLKSPDRVLTVKSDVAEEEIVSRVKGLGFKIERIG